MENTAYPDSGAETKGLSISGLWQVLTGPSAFFAKLKDDPKILVPYVVFGLAMACFLFYVSEYIVELQIAAMEEQGNLPPGVNPADLAGYMKYSAIGGGTIAMLLLPLASSALALFWGNFVFGGKAKYKQILSVALYGSIAYAVGALAAIPLIIAKDAMIAPFSLAVLAGNQGFDSVLFQALSKIDVFYIWEIIVVGIGLSTIYGMPRNKGYMISVLSIGMMSVLHVVATAIGKAFS
ncbi:MAG: hypothetical protein DRP45_09960 [Candidatus Zixiibacteriota bacterium]|nr:MAG: hypothetical protein DRP45_09960 [candidate division Zixibacteria bacterium]